MTATKKIIEDAVRGGWYPKNYKPERFVSQAIRAVQKSKFVERWLLEPAFWQAVGKTRGWRNAKPGSLLERIIGAEGWKLKMVDFVGHLTNGKTIEEALQAIE